MSRVVVKAIEDRAQLGIAMMIGAYFFFSLIDTSVKWLLISGIGALQLAFMRYLGHFVISLGAIARGGLDVERFKTEKPLLVLARAYLLWSSTVFNFISLNYLPLTVTGGRDHVFGADICLPLGLAFAGREGRTVAAFCDPVGLFRRVDRNATFRGGVSLGDAIVGA